MLFLLFSGTLLFAASSACPETPPEPPCTCRLIGYHARMITCNAADNEVALEKSLFSMRSSSLPIQTVEIFEATLNYLPSKVFKGLKFRKLFLAGSEMVSLSDTDTALVGLEDSLEILLVHECTFYGGWRWSQLRNLVSLRELRSVKSGPVSIDEDIKDIAHLNITDFFLTQADISYVHDTAFATFANLRMLSLKQNSISEFRRSMFPNPATKLEMLILSHNEIQHLPPDLFAEMPKLRTIILSDNKILSLDENVFKPVWEQLRKIDLLDNPLRCDCRLQWLLKVPFPLNTWANCQEPTVLKGVHLRNVTSKDLWC